MTWIGCGIRRAVDPAHICRGLYASQLLLALHYAPTEITLAERPYGIDCTMCASVTELKDAV